MKYSFTKVIALLLGGVILMTACSDDKRYDDSVITERLDALNQTVLGQQAQINDLESALETETEDNAASQFLIEELEGQLDDFEIANGDLEMDLNMVCSFASHVSRSNPEAGLPKNANFDIMCDGADPTYYWGTFYEGSPEDAWEMVPPTDVTFDENGQVFLPIHGAAVPSPQNPLFPNAATMNDLQPGTVVCTFIGDTTRQETIKEVGLYGYFYEGTMAEPTFWYAYTVVESGGRGSFQDAGILPFENGWWSADVHLEVGPCPN